MLKHGCPVSALASAFWRIGILTGPGPDQRRVTRGAHVPGRIVGWIYAEHSKDWGPYCLAAGRLDHQATIALIRHMPGRSLRGSQPRGRHDRPRFRGPGDSQGDHATVSITAVISNNTAIVHMRPLPPRYAAHALHAGNQCRFSSGTYWSGHESAPRSTRITKPLTPPRATRRDRRAPLGAARVLASRDLTHRTFPSILSIRRNQHAMKLPLAQYVLGVSSCFIRVASVSADVSPGMLAPRPPTARSRAL